MTHDSYWQSIYRGNLESAGDLLSGAFAIGDGHRDISKVWVDRHLDWALEAREHLEFIERLRP